MFYCIFIQVTSPVWSKQTCWSRLWPAWSLSTPSSLKDCGSRASCLRTPRWEPSRGAMEKSIKFQWCRSCPSSTSVSHAGLFEHLLQIIAFLMSLWCRYEHVFCCNGIQHEVIIRFIYKSQVRFFLFCLWVVLQWCVKAHITHSCFCSVFKKHVSLTH